MFSAVKGEIYEFDNRPNGPASHYSANLCPLVSPLFCSHHVSIAEGSNGALVRLHYEHPVTRCRFLGQNANIAKRAIRSLLPESRMTVSFAMILSGSGQGPKNASLAQPATRNGDASYPVKTAEVNTFGCKWDSECARDAGSTVLAPAFPRFFTILRLRFRNRLPLHIERMVGTAAHSGIA